MHNGNHHEIISAFISEKKEKAKMLAEFNGNNFEIPQEVLEDTQLSPIDKIVYLGLLNYYGCSKEEIIKRINICRGSFFKSLIALEKRGYVKSCLDKKNRKSLKLFSLTDDEANKKTENSIKRVSPPVESCDIKSTAITTSEDVVGQQSSLVDYIAFTFKKQVPKANFSVTALKILIKNLDKPREWYEELFKASEEQLAYLTGANRNKWAMTLNWLLRESNAQKVLDREFINR